MNTLKNLSREQFINIVLCPFAFFLIALAIISFSPEGPMLFRYDQQAVAQGEWWRFLSSHFTHSTWNHFFLNMLGLAILTVLFSQVATWRKWLSVAFFSSLFCSACFYFFAGNYYIYVGMSDILHGVIIAYAMCDYKHFKLGNIILIVGTLGKVIWEQSPWYIEASGDFIGGRVATESHFYGAISGIIIGVAFLTSDFLYAKYLKTQDTEKTQTTKSA
jgi:rhomboid family GlyGly-CTERM serine protease